MARDLSPEMLAQARASLDKFTDAYGPDATDILLDVYLDVAVEHGSDTSLDLSAALFRARRDRSGR